MTEAPTPSPTEATLATLTAWSEAGLLRRLDSALAAHLLTLDPAASPALLVSVALLSHLEGRGHTCLPVAALATQPLAVLGWPAAHHDAVRALWTTLPPDSAAWLSAMRASPTVGDAATPGGHTPLVLGGSAEAPLLYLRRYFGYESGVATQVAARAAQPFAVDAALARHWLDKLFDAPTPSAAAGASPPGPDWQKLACALALRAGLTVITGGPGTGKTHTAARLLALLFAFAPEPDRLRVALAAPTGKAAARLRQSIEGSLNDLGARLGSTDNGGLDLARLTRRMGPARTLHGLLGARPGTRQLRHHAGNPLDVDVLLVDEASMVHLEMVAALMAALPPQARVVLLGDKDQLASVEAGAVLGDLCQHAALGDYSEATRAYAQAVAGVDVPPAFWADPATPPAPLAQQTAMLRESRRFGGPIGQLASAVNAGDAATAEHLLAHAPAGGPLRRLASATPDALLAACVNTQPDAPASHAGYLQTIGQRPPQALAEPAAHAAWVVGVLTAFERFRVLCAVHEGPWGTQALNTAITQALAAAGLLQPTGAWYAGRPVMVTRNDPGLGVFNGDVGVALPALSVNGVGGGLRVWFLDGDALRSVGVARLAEVETAFAMTVHKSQGSEFTHTVLVLPPSGGEVLTRELVYTGITRAREAFTLVEPRAGLLAQAVARKSQRFSGLAQRLRAGAPLD